MPAILPEAKLAYFFVPKVACTSLKTMFFEVENGHGFTPYSIGGKKKTIHALYGSSMFRDVDTDALEGFTRFAVIREPVARVVSCYRDKIGKKNFLNKPPMRKKVMELGLPTKPTISEFVTHLDAYRKLSSQIRHHSYSLCDHLGKNPDYYTRIFPFSELTTFVEEVSRITGTNPTLPHKQHAKRNAPPVTPTDADIARIHEIFAEDYEVYGDRF